MSSEVMDLTSPAAHSPETLAEECNSATAEKHDRASATVQRVLKARGARSYIVHMHSLKLFGDGRPLPLGQLKRYTPELVIHSDAGWVIAVVTIGPRSGCYMVSIPRGPGIETVPSDRPERVANLVLAAQPGGRS
jgi:hypothetical protein